MSPKTSTQSPHNIRTLFKPLTPKSLNAHLNTIPRSWIWGFFCSSLGKKNVLDPSISELQLVLWGGGVWRGEVQWGERGELGAGPPRGAGTTSAAGPLRLLRQEVGQRRLFLCLSWVQEAAQRCGFNS